MDDVLQDIVNVLESWTARIVNVENKIEKIRDIQKIVRESLNRQVIDGLISEQDSIELEYTCDLWVNLIKTLLSISLGALGADRDVLTYLLELYTLKQISKELFISIALKLCRPL